MPELTLDNDIPLLGQSKGSNISHLENAGTRASIIDDMDYRTVLDAMKLPTVSASPDLIKRYNNPGDSFNGYNYLELEASYFDEQSPWERVKNNAIGFGTKAISTFLGDFDYRGEYGVLTGNKDEIEAWGFKAALLDWAQEKDEEHPVYRSKYMQDHPFLSFAPLNWRAFTASWGELFNNLGFTVGTIANAAVTDAALTATTGVGEFAMLPRQAAKIGTSIANAFKVGRMGKDGISTFQRGRQIVSATNSIKNSTRRLLMLSNMAVGEGTIEGYHNYKHLKQELIDDYLAENKLQDVSEIDPSVLAGMDKIALDAGKVTAQFNVGLLMLTNQLTMNILFRGAKTAEREMLLKAGKYFTAESAEKVAPASFSLFSRKGLSKAIFSPVKRAGRVRNMAIVEGVFEEGGQYTIENAVGDFYKNKYYNTKETDDALHSMIHGLSETFGTNEGLRNIAMGMFTGPVILGMGNVKNRAQSKTLLKNRGDYKSTSKRFQEAQAIGEKWLNSAGKGFISGLQAKYNSLAEKMTIAAQLREAVKMKDSFAYKSLMKDNIYAFAKSAAQLGRLDIRMTQIDMLKELNKESFEDMWGMYDNAENRQLIDNYLEQLKADVKTIAKEFKTSENIFGSNPFSKTREPQEWKEYEDALESFAYASYRIRVDEEGLEKTADDLVKKYPSVFRNKQIVKDMATPEGFKRIKENAMKEVSELRARKDIVDALFYREKPTTEFYQEETKTLDAQLKAEQRNAKEEQEKLAKEIEELDSLIKKLQSYEKVIVPAEQARKKREQADYLLRRKSGRIEFTRYNKTKDKAKAEKLIAEAEEIEKALMEQEANTYDDSVFVDILKHHIKKDVMTMLKDPKFAELESDLGNALRDINRHNKRLVQAKEHFNQLRSKRGFEAWKLDRQSFINSFVSTAVINNGEVEEILTPEEVLEKEIEKAVEKRQKYRQEVDDKEAVSRAEEEFAEQEGEEELKKVTDAKQKEEDERTEDEKEAIEKYDKIEEEKKQELEDERTGGLSNTEALSDEELEEIEGGTINQGTEIEEDSPSQNTQKKKAGHHTGTVSSLFGGLADMFTKAYQTFLEKGGNALFGIREFATDLIVDEYFLDSPLFNFVFKNKTKGFRIVRKKVNVSNEGKAQIQNEMYREITEEERLVIEDTEGNTIATIPNPNTILVNINEEMIPVAEAIESGFLDESNFNELIGRNIGSFRTFKRAQKQYSSLYDALSHKVSENGSVSEEEAKGMFKFSISIKRPTSYSKTADASNLISDLVAVSDESYIAREEDGEIVYYTKEGVAEEVPVKVRQQVEKLLERDNTAVVFTTKHPSGKAYSSFYARSTDEVAFEDSKDYSEMSRLLTVPVRKTIYDSVRVAVIPLKPNTKLNKTFKIQGLEFSEEDYPYAKAVGKNYSEIIRQLKRKNLITNEEDC